MLTPSGPHHVGGSVVDSTRRGFLAAMSAATTSNAGQSSNQPQDRHEHQTVPSDMTLRVKALESLLADKGLVDPAALDALVDTYENKVGPRNGAQAVARAWVDPDYKKRLLTDAPRAIAEFAYLGTQGDHLVVIENTPK